MTARPVAVFLLVAFGVAWSIWGVAFAAGVFAAGPTSTPAQLIVALGAFSPAIAAFVVRKATGEGFRDAGLALRLSHAWRLYLLALVVPLVVVGTVVLVAAAVGLTFVHTELPSSVLLGALASTPILAVLSFGEEFGWRGYLQQRWHAEDPLLAAVLTGAAWGIYHYPVILLGFEGYEVPLAGLVLFPAFAILHSIFQGWLVRRSGSIWTSCVAHGASNALGGSLLAYLFYGGGQWLLTSYAGVIALVPLGIVALWTLAARPARRRSHASRVAL